MQDPHPAHSGVYDPVGSATYCTKGSKQKLGMWRARTPPYTYSSSFFGFQLLHTPSSQPMRVPSLASFVVFFGLLPTHLRSLTQTLSNCRFCSLILAWLPAIVPSASCPIWRRVVSFSSIYGARYLVSSLACMQMQLAVHALYALHG